MAVRAALALWLVAGVVTPAFARATQQPDRLPVDIGNRAPVYASDSLTVHALRGVSNIYLVDTAGGVTLVDAGLPTQTRAIQRKLAQIGRADALCQIVLTHAHIDHVGAAAGLHEATGAPVLIHEADAEALRFGKTQLGLIRNWEWTRQALIALETMMVAAAVEPTRTLSDGDRLTDCGLDARFLHLPGHTPGSGTLMVKDPATGITLAFVGDLISTTGGAHVQSSYAANWQEVADSLARLQAEAPDLTFPGHGSKALRADELVALPLTGPAAR